jgi:hypothetical protein
LSNTVACVAVVASLAGLAHRRRLNQCYSFGAYLLAVLSAQTLMEIWPARFYTRDFWLATETTHQFLKLAIVVELAARTMSVFPGAQRSARRVLLITLIVLLALLATSIGAPEYARLVTDLLPRAVSGTVWLFCGLAAVIVWYRIPVTPFQKAILLGFCLFLLTYSILLSLIGSLGWQHRPVLNFANGLAFLAVQVYWAWAAWRRESPSRDEATELG